MLCFLAIIAASFGQICKPNQIRTSTHCCDGAMGSIYARIYVTNISRHECWLQAPSSVQSLDEDGKPVPVTVEANVELDRNGAGTPKFLLRPHARAALTVVTAGPYFPENHCGRSLQLNFARRVVRMNQGACGPPVEPARVSLSGFYPASTSE
jgi:hypothetical protein